MGRLVKNSVTSFIDDFLLLSKLRYRPVDFQFSKDKWRLDNQNDAGEDECNVEEVKDNNWLLQEDPGGDDGEDLRCG